jgi:ERCC4-related helicase
MKKWGERASKLKAPWSELEHWYEALRLHVVSWEEIPEQAAAYLLMMMTTMEAAFESRLKTMVSKSARFGELRAQLREKQAARGPAFRGIIFVRQRLMTHVLDYVISSSSSDEDCCLGGSVGAVCLYAQGPVNPSWGLSKEESRERLRKFRSGESKLLIATMAAEEGIDVPESNVVICYDEMQHSVSLCQRRGRARQEGSDFVVLRERPDRPVILLEQIERQQQEIIGSLQLRQETAESAEHLKAAQRNRERGAATVLNENNNNSSELATLNLYCKKTKVPLTEKWREGACVLSYESPLRSLEASAEGINRKAAKRKAASQLLNDLRADLKTTPHY